MPLCLSAVYSIKPPLSAVNLHFHCILIEHFRTQDGADEGRQRKKGCYITERWTNRQTDEQPDRQTDRQTDRQIDRWTARQTDRRLCTCTVVHLSSQTVLQTCSLTVSYTVSHLFSQTVSHLVSYSVRQAFSYCDIVKTLIRVRHFGLEPAILNY